MDATNCPGKNFDMAISQKDWRGNLWRRRDYEGHWGRNIYQKAINYVYMTGLTCDAVLSPTILFLEPEFARVLSFIIDRLERR